MNGDCDTCVMVNREIYVVTKVPPYPSMWNMCDDQLYVVGAGKDGEMAFFVLDDWESRSNAEEMGTVLPVKRENYHLGEIIICDGAGREVGGFRRKPIKSGHIKSDDPDDDHYKDEGLEFEEFDNLDDALDRARKVLDDRMGPWNPPEEPKEEI